ncbi:MAG: hypothetical protein ACTSUN_04755 [Promethearchaeota archaeon]
MQASSIYQELLERSFSETNIPLYRLFCYGFRAGGYLDIINQKIKGMRKDRAELRELDALSRAEIAIEKILALRGEPIPNNKYVIRRFLHYDFLFKETLKNLKEAGKKDKEIKKFHDLFFEIFEKIKNSEGHFLINWADPFVLKHGSIDLPDQGLKIIQGLFSDNFSLNHALISPGSSFYHDHAILWEFHFIDNYSKELLYEHFRAGKKFKITGNDIISMGPAIPHGGHNPENSIPFLLGFVSGSLKRGPWRFDFNDRGVPSSDNLMPAEKIDELNGVQLDPILKELSFNSRSNQVSHIVFPSQECDIIVKLMKIRGNFTVQPIREDSIVKILQGTGYMHYENTIEQKITSMDSFIIPKNMKCFLQSDNMSLLVFG